MDLMKLLIDMSQSRINSSKQCQNFTGNQCISNILSQIFCTQSLATMQVQSNYLESPMAYETKNTSPTIMYESPNKIGDPT